MRKGLREKFVTTGSHTNYIPYLHMNIFISQIVELKVEKSEFSKYFSSDMDECVEGTHNCDSNADCTNNEGSYTCSCKVGWTGEGTTGNCVGMCLIFDLFNFPQN